MALGRLVLIVFLVLQGWDGILTYIAVAAHGVGAEGNVLLATWMLIVGPTTALLGAKLLAAACGVLLYVCNVHRVLVALTIFYGIAAIGPWMLFFHLA